MELSADADGPVSFARRLGEAVRELDGALRKLLLHVERSVRDALGFEERGRALRSALRDRARPLLDHAPSGRLELFLSAAARAEDGLLDGWRSSLALAIADGLPPEHWNDDLANSLGARLRALRLELDELEHVARVAGSLRGSPWGAFASACRPKRMRASPSRAGQANGKPPNGWPRSGATPRAGAAALLRSRPRPWRCWRANSSLRLTVAARPAARSVRGSSGHEVGRSHRERFRVSARPARCRARGSPHRDAVGRQGQHRAGAVSAREEARDGLRVPVLRHPQGTAGDLRIPCADRGSPWPACRTARFPAR